MSYKVSFIKKFYCDLEISFHKLPGPGILYSKPALSLQAHPKA